MFPTSLARGVVSRVAGQGSTVVGPVTFQQAPGEGHDQGVVEEPGTVVDLGIKSFYVLYFGSAKAPLSIPWVKSSLPLAKSRTKLPFSSIVQVDWLE